MEWLVVIIKYHMWKLWSLELLGGFKPQQLRKNVYLALTIDREIKGFLAVGEGPEPY
jgi:hypothetical protein